MHTALIAAHRHVNTWDGATFLVCFAVALLFGLAVWAVVKFAFKQPWAEAAGAVTFLIALIICIFG